MRDRITYANVVATLALFIALGGVSWAAITLPDNSVGTRQLRNVSVTPDKLATHAVTGRAIAPRAVSTTRIKKFAITRRLLTHPVRHLLERHARNGAPGPEGAAGPTGEAGVAGANGDTGAAGAKGDDGPKGDNGAKGGDGPTGDKGPKGDNGSNGTAGPTGPTGPVGPTGPLGAAGGDLTGTFPNPTIATSAVNSAKVANDSLTGSDIIESTLGTVPSATSATSATSFTGSLSGDVTGTQSNTQIGSGTVGPAEQATLPSARVREDTPQPFPDSQIIRVALDTNESGSETTFDNANDQVTVNRSGLYLITGEIVWPNNGNGPRFLGIETTASGEIVADARNAVGGTNTVNLATTVTNLSAGTSVYLTGGQGSGGSLSDDPSFGRAARLTVSWLGPAAPILAPRSARAATAGDDSEHTRRRLG